MKNDTGASFSLQRRLQPAVVRNFGMFFNGVPMGLRPTQADEEHGGGRRSEFNVFRLVGRSREINDLCMIFNRAVLAR
jgi:hypothetical protein